MGFTPAFIRINNWMRWNVAGMYYSTIGLYAAFVSEILTRIPGLPLFTFLTPGTLAVTIIGVLVNSRHRKIRISYVNQL